MLSATGDLDSVGYSFTSEVTSSGNGKMALKWRFDYGSKYLSFESIANIASEAMSVSVATTSSEFKSFKASFDASKTASGIEVLTKIREDVMDVLEAHLLLENRSSHYLNSTNLFLSKKLRHFHTNSSHMPFSLK